MTLTLGLQFAQGLMKREINKIGVLTSGGDAPGMNACLRAVVRSAVYYEKEVVGIVQGYHGMIHGQFKELKARSVGNIIHRGGTFLKSARSEEFRTPEGRKQAYLHLEEHGVEALVVIGGDGSFKGAQLIEQEYGIPVMGIPGTIDNDLPGTDFTIGYDTACNTVVDAIDKIRDTASSHNRLFFIEVMGRDAGFIAVRAGLAVGAEAMLIPEKQADITSLVEILQKKYRSNKSFSLVVVAESGESGRAFQIAEEVRQRFNHYDSKVTILGHLQRGGSPSCFDRELASRMGVAAVEGLLDGKSSQMVGILNDRVVYTPLAEANGHRKTINEELLRIANILSI